jgi:hypothetical protein
MHDLTVKHGHTPHIRARGEEIKLKARTPARRARRWVVKATHSWLNRNRGILIRWSKKPENHLALLQLASGLIAFKKAHHATPQNHLLRYILKCNGDRTNDHKREQETG